MICVAGFHRSGWSGRGRFSEEVELMTDQTGQDLEGQRWQHDRGCGGQE